MRTIFLLLAIVLPLWPATFVTNQTGNWTTPATWRSGSTCGAGTIQTSVWPGQGGALDTVTICQNHDVSVTSGLVEVGDLNGTTTPAILVSGSTSNAFGRISVSRGATLRVRGSWSCTWNGTYTAKRYGLTLALGGIVEFDSTGDVSGAANYFFSAPASSSRACVVSAGADQTQARIVAATANGGNLQITTSAAQDWQTGEPLYLDAFWAAPKLADRLYTVTRLDATNFVLQGAPYSGGAWACQTQAPASTLNCPTAFLPAVIRTRPGSPTNARILSTGDVARAEVFGLEGQYLVLSQMGTATVDGAYMMISSTTGALDSTCANCRVIDSGRVFVGAGAGTGTAQGTHFDWQNLKVVRPLWAMGFRFNLDNANTGTRTIDGGAVGGRRFLRNCAIDGDLGQTETVGSATPGGVYRETTVDNCFVNGVIYSSGLSNMAPANRANQFSRMTSTWGGKGGSRWGFEYCPAAECVDYFRLRLPSTGNSKGALAQTQFSNTWRRYTTFSNSALGSYQEDVTITGSAPATLLTHLYTGLVCLPGPALSSCGPFTLFGNQPNNRLQFESNTLNYTGHATAVFNAGETGNTYNNQTTVFRNNLAFPHAPYAQQSNVAWAVDQRAATGNGPCATLANCDSPVDPVSPAGYDFNALHLGVQSRPASAVATYWNQCQGTDTVGCLIGAGNTRGLGMKLSTANAGPNNIEVQWPNWVGPQLKAIRHPFRFDIEFLSGVMKMPEHGVKPTWVSGQSYAVGDEVSSTTSFFGGQPVNWVCIRAHTSSAYTMPGRYTMLESTAGSNDAFVSSFSGLTGTFTQANALLTINNRRLQMPSSGTRTFSVPDNRQSYVWVHALTWAGNNTPQTGGTWENILTWELRVSDVAAGLSCSENGSISGVLDENCWLVARVTASGGTASVTMRNAGADSANLAQSLLGAEDTGSNPNAGRIPGHGRFWMPRSVMVLLDITSTWNVPEMGIVNENAHRALALWSRDGMRPTNGQIRGKGFQGRTPGAMEFDGRNPAWVGPITQ